MHYHDSDDLKRLGEFKQLAPREFSAFVEFDKIVGREDGTIPRKYRELIAIALACTTQCPYCLDVHTRAAKRAGATREEVSEAAMLAAALRAGAAVTHGALAVKLFDKVPASQAAGAEAGKGEAQVSVSRPGVKFSVRWPSLATLHLGKIWTWFLWGLCFLGA